MPPVRRRSFIQYYEYILSFFKFQNTRWDNHYKLEKKEKRTMCWKERSWLLSYLYIKNIVNVWCVEISISRLWTNQRHTNTNINFRHSKIAIPPEVYRNIFNAVLYGLLLWEVKEIVYEMFLWNVVNYYYYLITEIVAEQLRSLQAV